MASAAAGSSAASPSSGSSSLILSCVSAAATAALLVGGTVVLMRRRSKGSEGAACQDAGELLQQLQRERARADELQQRLQSLAAKATQPAARRAALQRGSNGATPVSSSNELLPAPAAPLAQQPQGQQQQEGAEVPVFSFCPIGVLRSCFTTRNGTPRQPLLVPSARSRLVMLPDVPDASLQGLHEWSHAWILYVFHENTESALGASSSLDLRGVKGKVKVPRLNGQKVGLFATRTPHRPVPVGLSVAQVLEVRGRTVVFGGADIVDGSPILDIKPYVPFCDSVPLARAPAYVQAEAEDEPLAVSTVVLTPVGRLQLAICWRRNGRRTLYRSAQDFIDFVCQALSRDIRSTRQRLDVGAAAQQRNAASLQSAAKVAAALTTAPQQAEQQEPSDQREGAGGGSEPPPAGQQPQAECEGATGVFHVVFEGVDVSYDVAADGSVLVGGATLASALALQHAHKHRN